MLFRNVTVDFREIMGMGTLLYELLAILPRTPHLRLPKTLSWLGKGTPSWGFIPCSLTFQPWLRPWNTKINCRPCCTIQQNDFAAHSRCLFARLQRQRHCRRPLDDVTPLPSRDELATRNDRNRRRQIPPATGSFRWGRGREYTI